MMASTVTGITDFNMKGVINNADDKDISATSAKTAPSGITAKTRVTRVVKYTRDQLLRIREAMKLSLIPVALPKATSISISTLGLEALPASDMPDTATPDLISLGSISTTRPLDTSEKMSTLESKSDCNESIDLGVVNSDDKSNNFDVDFDFQAKHQDDCSTTAVKSASLRKAERRWIRSRHNQAWLDTTSFDVPNRSEQVKMNSEHSHGLAYHNQNSKPSARDVNTGRIQRSVSISSNESADSTKDRQKQIFAPPDPSLAKDLSNKQRSALKRRNASPLKAKPKATNIPVESDLSALSNTGTSSDASEHASFSKDETKPPPGPKRRQRSPLKVAHLASVTSPSDISSPEITSSVTFVPKESVSSTGRERSVTYAAKQGLMTVHLQNDIVKNSDHSYERPQQRKFADKTPNCERSEQHETELPKYAVIDTSIPTYNPENDDVRSTASNDSKEEQSSRIAIKPRRKGNLYTDLRNANKVRREQYINTADQFVNEDRKNIKTSKEHGEKNHRTLRKSTLQRSHSLQGNRSKGEKDTGPRQAYQEDLDSIYSSYHSEGLQSNPKAHLNNVTAKTTVNFTENENDRGNHYVKRSKSFGKQKDNVENANTNDQNFNQRKMFNGENVRRTKSLRENTSQKPLKQASGYSHGGGDDASSDGYPIPSRTFLKAKGGRNAHCDTYSTSQYSCDATHNGDILRMNENDYQSVQNPRADAGFKSNRMSNGRPMRSKSFHETHRENHSQSKETFGSVQKQPDTIQMMNDFYDQLYSSKESQSARDNQDTQRMDKSRSKSAPRVKTGNRSKSQSNQNRRPASPERSPTYQVVTTDTSAPNRHVVRLVAMSSSQNSGKEFNQATNQTESNNPWINFKNIDPVFMQQGAVPVFTGKSTDTDSKEGQGKERHSKPDVMQINGAQSSVNDVEQNHDTSEDPETARKDPKSARAARNALRRRRQREKKRMANASHRAYSNADFLEYDSGGESR